MSDEPTTSPATGAIPSTGPATGPSTGAMPTKTTLEEALARIADLERHSKNKEEEASRHGKNLTSVQKELDAYKEKERLAQEAALSEVEKANKRAVELEQQVAQLKQELISKTVQLIAKEKGIIDSELASLAIQKTLEFGDDGMPSNVDKALDDLIKNKPFLVPPKQEEKPVEQPSSPAQTAQAPAFQTPAIPAMNPGRTAIAHPNQGQLPPGPLRLDQIQWKRRGQ